MPFDIDSYLKKYTRNPTSNPDDKPSAASSSESFWNSPAYRDFIRGLGAGLRSYDPNNMFAGAGAAMEAAGQRQNVEDQEKRREAQAIRMADYEAGKRMELAKEERGWRKEDIAQQREWGLEDYEQQRIDRVTDMDLERKQKREDIEWGIKKKAEIEKEMRGQFYPLISALRNQGAPTFSGNANWHPPMK